MMREGQGGREREEEEEEKLFRLTRILDNCFFLFSFFFLFLI